MTKFLSDVDIGLDTPPHRVRRLPKWAETPDEMRGPPGAKGLIYAMLIETADGQEHYRTNTDWHCVTAMLFLSRRRLTIGESFDLYLHDGVSMFAMPQTEAAMRAWIERLRNHVGVRMAVLWHARGDSAVRFDISEGLTIDAAEAKLEAVAREETMCCVDV